MPLMPWQQHVLDVALELDDDGGLVYSEVDLSAPRQNGKTAIVLSKLVHRANALAAFSNPGAPAPEPQNILYTAQDRNNARKKWLEDHVKRLRRTRAFREGKHFDVRLSNGSEAILWRNGSTHGICAPTDTAAHGETLDEGVIDEAFAHEDDAVEQGMAPAMITRRNKQFFVLSTAGNGKSKYLWRKVLVGRRLVDAGISDKIAYFEWSAPDDADPADPAVWAACNPALGRTITEEALRAEYVRLTAKGVEGLNQFKRAHLNQWVEIPVLDDVTQEWVIPEELWSACGDERARPRDPVCFALDVSPDRTWAAIGVGAEATRSASFVQVVDHHPGTGWVAGRVADLVNRWSPQAVVLDVGSPAAALLPELERLGVKVTRVGAREYGQACGLFHDAAVNRRIRHVEQPELTSAVAGASKRNLGDAWAWDRKHSSVDITPLVAVTLAHWAHRQATEQLGDPADNIW